MSTTLRRALRVSRQFYMSALLLLPSIAILLARPPVALASTPTLTRYTIPGGFSTRPADITVGPDGALWFTQANGKVDRITTAGAITAYTVPTNLSSPQGITTGADGNLWFTENGKDKIGSLTPNGTFTEYQIPTTSFPNSPSGNATDITAGVDGALWFSEPQAAQIGRITTSGAFTEYPIPSGDTPNSITLGSDGNVWFAAYSSTTNINTVGRITPAGVITEFTVPGGATPQGSLIDLANGPDGKLWATDSISGAIDSITMTGVTTQYTLPTGTPMGITTGPDGALWITLQGVNNTTLNEVGRITTSGTFSVIQQLPGIVPSGPGVNNIVTGPDGALWLTAGSAGSIFKLALPNLTAPTGLIAASPAQHPSLSWDSVVGAASYNIYRNSTKIASTTSTSYVNTTAPEGTDTYYVTAVNSNGESDPSSSIDVLVDTTPPLITYTLSPTADEDNWNNTNVEVDFYCNDDGGSGLASCTPPVTRSSEGAGQTVTGTAIDNAGNTSTITATVNIDKTAPTIASPTMSTTLILLSGTATLGATAHDSLSGAAGGEYYIDTDPGQGNGTPMAYASGALSATATISGLSIGSHTLYMRSVDDAGNWSTPVSVSFIFV